MFYPPHTHDSMMMDFLLFSMAIFEKHYKQIKKRVRRECERADDGSKVKWDKVVREEVMNRKNSY